MSSEYTSEELVVYLNFLGRAFLGNHQIDLFVSKYGATISKVAEELRTKMPIEESELYRGILLEPKEFESGKLKSIRALKTLSFSTSPEVALQFASTEDFLSSFVMSRKPESKGFLIIENTKELKNEILYHHSWFDNLSLYLGMFKNKLDLELLRHQREVIVLNQNKDYDLISYEDFKSNGYSRLPKGDS